MDVQYRGHPGDGVLADATTRTGLFRGCRARNSSASATARREESRTQENYMPGSIFKTGGRAWRRWRRLEPGGISTSARSRPARQRPYWSAITLSRTRPPPGDYNFRRALKLFEQFLFHHLRAAHGSGADYPPGPAPAFRRTHRLANPPGGHRQFPSLRRLTPAGPTAPPATFASGKTRSGSRRCKSRC